MKHLGFTCNGLKSLAVMILYEFLADATTGFVRLKTLLAILALKKQMVVVLIMIRKRIINYYMDTGN